MSIVNNLLKAFAGKNFSLKDAYDVNPTVNTESVRARIYENIGVSFTRLGKGLYAAEDVVVIEGDGRDLSILNDNSIDCIITDHPWEDLRATKGGTRNFANYPVFQYTLADFIEKARVLKEGSFLCEIIPAESETNFDYLYNMKKMAEQAGFKYYAKVPWKKGTFVSNTGRKAKNTEDLMIFSKGPARKLRPDKQRGVDANGNPTRFMSGANGMLPTCFDIQAVPKKQQIAQSEKPVQLFEQLLEFLTLPGEVVLDQFAGSGVVGEACLKKKRRAILIEFMHDKVVNIAARVNAPCIVSVS